MKTKITGKRFSRIQTTTPETWAELDELFAENGGKLGCTFAEMLAGMVDGSRAILRDKGLPDVPRLWWRKGSDDWQAEPLTFEECGRASNLDHHILKTLKKPHDSPEGIAAQIIMCAHRLATWEGDSRDKEIFNLGYLYTTLRVYGEMAKFGSAGAKRNKEEGAANQQAVLDAARSILKARTRKTSDRLLAELVAIKTSIPFNTVRGHIQKLRKDKTLD